ncbi:hypothetical protein [Kitasatospora sp. NBC_01302]|uniref:hypothetical protein n=1 Tax=Kitasatospora sp. NBC_01302 TaxID=2903575 RepID=UPI002E0D2EB9|nr:hypothetical protein OG294_13850 [Kitasatospora sp. NBC_01302]
MQGLIVAAAARRATRSGAEYKAQRRTITLPAGEVVDVRWFDATTVVAAGLNATDRLNTVGDHEGETLRREPGLAVGQDRNAA